MYYSTNFYLLTILNDIIGSILINYCNISGLLHNNPLSRDVTPMQLMCKQWTQRTLWTPLVPDFESDGCAFESLRGRLFICPRIPHFADCAKFRPLANHETPWRHSKNPHHCDTRRHSHSGDHKRERRRVF